VPWCGSCIGQPLPACLPVCFVVRANTLNGACKHTQWCVQTPAPSAALSTPADLPVEKLVRRLQGLSEVNPMLGLRGCRLGIVHPDISFMQVRGWEESSGLHLLYEGTSAGIDLVSYGASITTQGEVIWAVHAFIARSSQPFRSTGYSFLFQARTAPPRCCNGHDALACSPLTLCA
jgi:hypothetical protein